MRAVTGTQGKQGNERSKRFALFATLVLSLSNVLSASADVISWTGGVDGDWNTPGNWAGGAVPGSADIADFHATGAMNLSVTLSTDSTIDGLAFNANATDSVTINVTGAAPLRLDGGAATDIEILAGSHTIQGQGGGGGTPSEMIVTGSHHWHVADGAMLVINARLIGANWPNSNTYIKSGAGTLVLGGSNSGNGGWNFHSGWFRIDEGTVRIHNTYASGDWHNAFNVTVGATLEASNGITWLEMRNGTFSLAGEGDNGVGALHVTTGTTTTFPAGNGSMFLAADATINVSAGTTFIVNQNVTGTGIGSSLTKIGGGTLVLTSAQNVYGGFGQHKRTTINEGALTLAPGGELRIRILNNGISHRINGGGTVNLDGLLRLQPDQLTDTEGTWNIVDVSTLTVNWGESFDLAFVGDEENFMNQGDGTFTYGMWTFDQATGNLTLGDVEPKCAPDLNGDGVVDVSDLLTLLAAWGPCSGCDADINGDGVIDVSDLLMLLSAWGGC